MKRALAKLSRIRLIPIVGFAVVVAAGILAVKLHGSRQENAWTLVQVAQAAPKPEDAVARGKYLVTALGCNHCHTPLKMGPKGPEPDMSHMLSGHPADLTMPQTPLPQPPWGWMGAMTGTAFLGPWGTSFASNLTPDEETGVGVWDDKLFIKVMREGKLMGAGRPLMPPMPWENYGQMTDDDLKAILAYLRTVPPLKNKVPDYIPPAGGSGAKPK